MAFIYFTLLVSFDVVAPPRLFSSVLLLCPVPLPGPVGNDTVKEWNIRSEDSSSETMFLAFRLMSRFIDEKVIYIFGREFLTMPETYWHKLQKSKFEWV
jgi:hypothetical protein